MERKYREDEVEEIFFFLVVGGGVWCWVFMIVFFFCFYFVGDMFFWGLVFVVWGICRMCVRVRVVFVFESMWEIECGKWVCLVVYVCFWVLYLCSK